MAMFDRRPSAGTQIDRGAPMWELVFDWSDTNAFHNSLVVGSSPTSSTTQMGATGNVLPASHEPGRVSKWVHIGMHGRLRRSRDESYPHPA